MNNNFDEKLFDYGEEKNPAENGDAPQGTAPEKRSLDKKRSKPLDVKRLVGIAMFSALAYATTFVFHIPVSFLTFDAKDAVLTIAAFIYGPVAAVLMSAAVSLIELITISGTGAYGLIMNFSSSVAFSATAALIYKYRRSFSGAIIALYSASLVTVGVMMALNMLVTPYYMGVDTATVKSLIPTLLLPFNTAKTLMNSAIAMLLYKPVSQAMYRAGMLKGKKPSMKFNKYSALLLAFFAVTLTAAIVLFIVTKGMN